MLLPSLAVTGKGLLALGCCHLVTARFLLNISQSSPVKGNFCYPMLQVRELRPGETVI